MVIARLLEPVENLIASSLLGLIAVAFEPSPASAARLAYAFAFVWCAVVRVFCYRVFQISISWKALPKEQIPVPVSWIPSDTPRRLLWAYVTFGVAYCTLSDAVKLLHS